MTSAIDERARERDKILDEQVRQEATSARPGRRHAAGEIVAALDILAERFDLDDWDEDLGNQDALYDFSGVPK